MLKVSTTWSLTLREVSGGSKIKTHSTALWVTISEDNVDSTCRVIWKSEVGIQSEDKRTLCS